MKQTIKNLFRCTIALAALLITGTASADEVETFKITKAETANGSFAVTVGGTAAEAAAAGATVTITATPDAGYEADGTPEVSVTTSWGQANTRADIPVEETIDVTAGTTANTWTFTMPNDPVTVSVTFKESTYTIDIASDITGGTVKASAASGNMGDEITLTVTPAEGYELETCIVKDAAGNAITVTDGKFIMPAGNVTVSATFKKITYTITVASDITGGTVKASAASGNMGDEITLTATPAEGYELEACIVKDAAGNAITVTDGKFIMPAGNVTVSATFKKSTYTITIASDITGGMVKVSAASGNMGDEITLTATPAEGYELEAYSVKDAAGNAIEVKDGKFTLPASNVTVSATFKKIPIPTYTVTIASDITGGTVTASAASGNAGDEITLTATPAEGYEFEAYSVKDAAGNAIEVKDGKFTLPASNVTVSATFKKAGRKVVDETKPVETEDGKTLYELTDDYKKAIDIVDGVTIALSEHANIQADADSEGHLVVQKGKDDVDMLLMDISAGSEIVFEHSGKIICEDGNLVKTSVSKARTRGEDEMSVEPGATYKVLKDCDIYLTLKTSVSAVKITSITITLKKLNFVLERLSNLMTVCLPFDAAVPEGCVLYKFAGVNNVRSCIIREVAEQKIEAGYPYLLLVGSSAKTRGEDGKLTVDFTPSGDTVVDLTTPLQEVTNGYLTLKGTFEDITNAQDIAAKAYRIHDKKGWFISKDTAEEDADKVYIPAFHAYFVTNDGSEPTGIGTQYYGWIDTAIDSYELENADGTSVWFDLSGRRLEGKPSKKGIYIQNGKKVTFEY